MDIYAAGYLSAGCLRHAFAASTQCDVALLAVHEAVARKHVWSVLARLIREIRWRIDRLGMLRTGIRMIPDSNCLSTMRLCKRIANTATNAHLFSRFLILYRQSRFTGIQSMDRFGRSERPGGTRTSSIAVFHGK